jgi:hypothetical protein
MISRRRFREGAASLFRRTIMLVTNAEVAAGRRQLFQRARDRLHDHPDFRVRPISERWRLADRLPAYKTAVANAAYIWRDSAPSDRFGPMPKKFQERRCELQGFGLILPSSAPLWATQDYRVWKEADAATVATGDPTEIAAWHVMMEIPAGIKRKWWDWLVVGMAQRELAGRGAITAWAVHALEGDDGEWAVKPHVHLIVTARSWRHDHRLGRRHAGGIASWPAQIRLEHIWRSRCAAALQMGAISPSWLTQDLPTGANLMKPNRT